MGNSAAAATAASAARQPAAFSPASLTPASTSRLARSRLSARRFAHTLRSEDVELVRDMQRGALYDRDDMVSTGALERELDAAARRAAPPSLEPRRADADAFGDDASSDGISTCVSPDAVGGVVSDASFNGSFQADSNASFDVVELWESLGASAAVSRLRPPEEEDEDEAPVPRVAIVLPSARRRQVLTAWL